MLLAGVGAWVATKSLFIAVLALVVTAFVPRQVIRYMRKRRLEAMELQLPDTLMMLAGGMKAGVSLTQAMNLLFTTRMGYATLAVIALLEFFGVLIIRKIVDIDV